MKFLPKDEDFWREFNERLQELEQTMTARRKAAKKGAKSDAVR